MKQVQVFKNSSFLSQGLMLALQRWEAQRTISSFAVFKEAIQDFCWFDYNKCYFYNLVISCFLRQGLMWRNSTRRRYDNIPGMFERVILTDLYCNCNRCNVQTLLMFRFPPSGADARESNLETLMTFLIVIMFKEAISGGFFMFRNTICCF